MDSLPNRIDMENAREVAILLRRELPQSGELTVDLTQVEAVDSAGVAVLVALAREADRRGVLLKLDGVQQEVRNTLEIFPFPSRDESGAAARVPGLLEDWGERASQSRDVAFQYLVLCSEVAWFTVAGLFAKRGIRWRETVKQMALTGSQALGVVGLIAFLVGGTLALQSAQQLRNFGANIFVVDLVGLAVTRELGPLITAIVIAGRSGSAIAAEIGTMRITEELDALHTMGINPVRYLVVPKFLAVCLTQPLLTMFANVLAVSGGFIVAIAYLDVAPTPFLSRLQEIILVRDIITGLVKSVAFAGIIVTIGTLCGMRTGGGADAVGRSTTTSVVASIFAVIVADAAFSLFFYF